MRVGKQWKSCSKRHTIKPGLASKFGSPQFLPQSWPQTNFRPGFKSWPGLKFGLLNNAWHQHFSQTDIFSVILISFIDWFNWIRFFLHKDNIYMLYFCKMNIQVICQQFDWFLWFWCYTILKIKISLGLLIWAGQCTWACFITFRTSMWLDFVRLYTYIKHNCSYQHCPVTQYCSGCRFIANVI